jgi:hypothetical protein
VPDTTKSKKLMGILMGSMRRVAAVPVSKRLESHAKTQRRKDTPRQSRDRIARSIWSARSLLPLSTHPRLSKAPASWSHSKRFAEQVARDAPTRLPCRSHSELRDLCLGAFAPLGEKLLAPAAQLHTPAILVPQARHLPSARFTVVTAKMSRSTTAFLQLGHQVVSAPSRPGTLPTYT